MDTILRRQVRLLRLDIEVNIQLSDFVTELQDDFSPSELHGGCQLFVYSRERALRDSSDIACAEVMHTTNRYWWRLVGRRYDVISWSPDIKYALDPQQTEVSQWTSPRRELDLRYFG
jgi:hypothetical protein